MVEFYIANYLLGKRSHQGWWLNGVSPGLFRA